MSTAADRLAEFALGLTPADIPEEVRAAAKLHVLDALGCGLAGAATQTATEARAVAALEGGAAEATVIGLRLPLPAAAAAMANGMLFHGLDYDDTLAATGTHLSAVAAPTVLAMGERVRSGGGEVLTAFVAAAESVAAIGLAAPFAMHRRGFHATSVYGVFGAALASARLLGLDHDRAVAALGIAGSFASGIFEYLADGSPTKPIHAGWAAHAGVRAALLAERGARGPATVLEGRFGLFATHADLAETALQTSLAGLGRSWHTPEIAFKPYPSCHFIHGALDAARQALGGHVRTPGEVESIVVTVAQDAVAFVLEPQDDKRAPRTGYDAKFSLPFSVAALVVDGDVDVATYAPDRLSDPRLLALAGKVRYEVGPYDDAFAGGAQIELTDGQVLTGAQPHPRDLNESDVRRKFQSNAGLALGQPDVDSLEAAVLHLDDVAELGEALAPLTRAAPMVSLVG